MAAVNASVGDGGVAARILDAAFACMSANGFDKTRIEDIAFAAGVSRATLYRHFSSRDQIFIAALANIAEPHDRACAEIAAGEGSYPERLAAICEFSVLTMSRLDWLKPLVRDGLSPEMFNLLYAAQKASSARVVLPFLERGFLVGELRPGLQLSEISSWLLRCVLEFGTAEGLAEQDITRRVHTFILPVLLLDAPTDQSDITTRLDRLQMSVDALRPAHA